MPTIKNLKEQIVFLDKKIKNHKGGHRLLSVMHMDRFARGECYRIKQETINEMRDWLEKELDKWVNHGNEHELLILKNSLHNFDEEFKQR